MRYQTNILHFTNTSRKRGHNGQLRQQNIDPSKRMVMYSCQKYGTA